MNTSDVYIAVSFNHSHILSLATHITFRKNDLHRTSSNHVNQSWLPALELWRTTPYAISFALEPADESQSTSTQRREREGGKWVGIAREFSQEMI